MLAGGDDVVDELLAVHTDLHGGPVLGQLRRKLQVIAGFEGPVFGQPEHRFVLVSWSSKLFLTTYGKVVHTLALIITMRTIRLWVVGVTLGQR